MGPTEQSARVPTALAAAPVRPALGGHRAPTAFLSHSSRDFERVRDLAERLRRAGIETWLPEQDLVAGEAYPEAISGAVRSCDAVVVLLSRHANQSAYVSRELALAVSRGKVVVPFLLDDVAPATALELHLAGLHAIMAWKLPPEEATRQLVAAIRHASSVVAPDPSAREIVRPGARRRRRRALVVFGAALLVLAGGSIPPWLATDRVYARGYRALRSGQPEEAEGIFRKLRYFPTARARRFEGLAAIDLASRRVDEGRGNLAQALSLQPDLVYAWVLDGELDAARRELGDAGRSFRRALTAKHGLDWQRAMAHCRLAQMALGAGDAGAAESELAAAAELDETLPELASLRAELALSRDDGGEARTQLERLLARDPGQTGARVLLDELTRTDAERRDAARRAEIDGLTQELVQRYRGNRSAPETSAPSSQSSSGSATLVVLGLRPDPLEARPNFSRAFESVLFSRLHAAPSLRLVDRSVLDQTLRELALGSSELADPATRLRLGRLTSARFLLTGSIRAQVAEPAVQLTVIDTETTDVVLALDEPFDPFGDPREIAARFAERVAAALRDELEPAAGGGAEP